MAASLPYQLRFQRCQRVAVEVEQASNNNYLLLARRSCLRHHWTKVQYTESRHFYNYSITMDLHQKLPEQEFDSHLMTC
jgi:hypothetical protein